MPPATTGSESDRGRIGSSRDRILMAAKQLFAERGYENTSTVAIARLAGTSESQLMKHFGSKEGLLEAIFDTGWVGLADALASLRHAPSPIEKLRTLLETTLAGFERDPELKKLMLLEGRRVRREGRMVLTTDGYLKYIAVIDAILSEMRDAGQLRPDLNPQAVRSALIGIFEGILRDQMLAEKDGFPSTASVQDLRQIFDLFLPALGPHKHALA